jgi:hypothetical protein
MREHDARNHRDKKATPDKSAQRKTDGTIHSIYSALHNETRANPVIVCTDLPSANK